MPGDGLRVVRSRNDAVLKDLSEVVEIIKFSIEK